MAEAAELGVAVYLVTGGEPFLRPELLDIASAHPRMLFPVFTNGLLIDDALVMRLRTLKNIVPLISLEGSEDMTDLRRGRGVHGHVLNLMRRLRAARVLFGALYGHPQQLCPAHQ